MGWNDETLVGYSRLIPPGVAFDESSIGRVATAISARGKNVGRELMVLSIQHIYKLFGVNPITIGAQLYLKKFYESLGFIQMSEMYLEDGIEHIHMRLSR
jgi:ElaA protein